MRLLEGDGLIVMRLFGVGPVLGFQLKSDYEGAQAAFKSASPDKIYIDINAGLMSGKDVSDLAKYAMLRTFSHEFIHFVEYWNPVQYNVLRKLVFDEITARGENVNDLIESKMDSTGLSYEKASREVVAEAMTDILPDSKFVKNMAEKHKSLFHKLVEKLKEFVADLRAYFDTIGGNCSAEANALKEQFGDTIKYIDTVIPEGQALFVLLDEDESVAVTASRIKSRHNGIVCIVLGGLIDNCHRLAALVLIGKGKRRSLGKQSGKRKHQLTLAVAGIALQQRHLAEGDIGMPQPAYLFRGDFACLDDFQLCGNIVRIVCHCLVLLFDR